MAIRRYQSQEGKLPDALRKIANNIITLGHSVDIEDKHKKARASVGLPELPPTIIRHPEMLGEIKAIIEARELTKYLSGGGDD
jgi:heterodisulfide reductase subunit C